MNDLVDRVIFAVAQTYDNTDPETGLWAHLRRDPEAFREAVSHAMQGAETAPTLKDGTPVLTKADCLQMLGDIERSIEHTESAMGKGMTERDVELGDLIRRGRLESARYWRGKLINMILWKGIEIEGRHG
jgi:hypothetical protein